jgi:hypothetical protein
MQFKKIDIYGRDLEDFKPKRNAYNESVYLLTHKQTVAITYLINKWRSNEEDAFIMTAEEAIDLVNKLKKNIGYEEI